MLQLKGITGKGLSVRGLLLGKVTSPAAAEAFEPSSAETRDGPTRISTQGSGEVSVDPDSFRLSVGVETRDKTIEKARSKVNVAMEQILQALKSLEISGLRLQTEILRIMPVYARKTSTTARPRITGYSAASTVSVTVAGKAPDELVECASRIIDTGISNGANRVGNVRFFLENSNDAQEQALKAALEDATRKARVIASAAGVRNIELSTVEERYSYQPARKLSQPMKAAGAARLTPIESGRITVTSSITAQFVPAPLHP